MFSFIAITLLSFIAFAIELNTFSINQSVQKKLSNKTLPYMEKSQLMHQDVFDYILVLERLLDIRTETNLEDDQKKVTLLKFSIRNKLEDLQSLVNNNKELATISSLLEDIFKKTSSLQKSYLSNLSDAYQSRESNYTRSLSLIKDIARRVKKHKITTVLQEKPVALNDNVSSLLTHTSELKNVILQLHATSNRLEIDRNKQIYADLMRRISKSILAISDEELKKFTAEKADALLGQLDANRGVFADAYKISYITSRAELLIKDVKSKQQELNYVMTRLTQHAATQANENIIAIDRTAEWHMSLLLLILGITFIFSITITFFYIQPDIIDRINTLSETTRKIASGNYNVNIDLSGKDEIAILSTALNGFRNDLITKKHIEEAEQNSRTFLQLIMNNNPDLISVRDNDLKLISANEAFLNCYPEDKRNFIIGDFGLQCYSEYASQEVMLNCREAITNGSAEQFETILQPDEKERQYFTRRIRFQNISGDCFLLCISRDMTEQEDLISKLTESNEELERFAFVASHDLQEPLRMIRSFTQLIASQYSDKLDQKALKYIDISISAAARMQDLIEDLLEYARVRESNEKLEETNIEDSLKYVLTNLEELIKSTGAHITHDPMPVVQTLPVRFSRVMQNLIGNGLKYQTPGNKPKIHISAEETEDNWVFGIQDNGIGIKKEYCEQIFLPFKRLHGQKDYAGTGMGLSICRKIIESMGGTIWVTSELDIGSKFYFSVPKRTIFMTDIDKGAA